MKGKGKFARRERSGGGRMEYKCRKKPNKKREEIAILFGTFRNTHTWKKGGIKTSQNGGHYSIQQKGEKNGKEMRIQEKPGDGRTPERGHEVLRDKKEGGKAGNCSALVSIGSALQGRQKKG